MRQRRTHSSAYMQQYKDLANKYFKLHVNGNGHHGYVSFDEMCRLAGQDNVISALRKAMDCKSETYSRKLRSGIRLDFYAF